MTSAPLTFSRPVSHRSLAGLLAFAAIVLAGTWPLAASGPSSTSAVLTAADSSASAPSPAPVVTTQAATKAPAPQATGKPPDISPMFDESKLRRRIKPISCGTGQNSNVGGVLLEIEEGVAVTVGTGCNMRLRSSIIVGTETAIVVKTGGNLWLDRSDIQSQDVAIRLETGANFYVSGSLITGRLVKETGANVADKGTTTWK